MMAPGSPNRPALATEGQVERIRLFRVSPTLGFAEIRLPWVNLTGLRVEEGKSGQLTVTPPERVDRNGRSRPVYALQPIAREAIEREISILWARG